MPSVGYATLQIMPSMRGIGAEIRAQLVGPAGDAGQQAGGAAGSGLKDKLKVGAAAAGVAAGALLVKGITQAIDQANVTSTLQAQLGATGKDAARYGKLAGKLYSSGVSDSFEGAAEAIKSVMQSGIAPPGATNAQLEKIATKASDVASVFGQDLGGVTNAVSQMMRTGLAKSSTQAFDLITKGFQSGADKGGDFLDTINEYGTQFRKAGLDGSQSIGLINQAIKAGARDSDIAADAIKEFSIRAIDGSDNTINGFKALGLNADNMATKFAKGGKAANGVLDITLDRLRGIKDPVKQSQIAVQLFGTQAEDLGQALYAMDPSKAAKGIGDVGGAADKMGKTIRSGPAHEVQVFTRGLQQAFVDVLGGQVLPVLAQVGGWVNTNLLPPLSRMASTAGAVLVPALMGLWSAGESVVGWLKDMGTWLIPIGIAVAGFTAALLAQQIATAGVTAVFSIYRGALLAWTLVQRGATIAQAAFNAVMNANPIVLVITAILALGAAFVVAYQRSETFRSIVQAAWQGIQTAALWAWNSVLKPVFNGIVTAAQAVGAAAVWLWQSAILPAFQGIWLVARVLFAVVVTAVLIPIIAVFKLVSIAAIGLWTYGIQPTFQGIAALATWLWSTVVRPIFSLIVGVFRGLGRVAMWLWHNMIAPAFAAMGVVIGLWWTGVKVTFNAVRSFITGPLASGFRWLRDKVIIPVWNGIKTATSLAWNGVKVTLSTVWATGIKPVFSAVKRAVGAVKDAFDTAATGIGKSWSGIKSKTRGPVQFVVDVVYNDGIRAVWNKVAGLVGLKKLDRVKFADGGRTRGGVPGRDSIPALMMADEFVVKRSSARSVGYGTLDYINRTGQLPVQRFAGGGIVSDVTGWLGDKARKVGGFIMDGVDLLSDPSKMWSKATGAIRDKIAKIGSSKWAQLLAKLPLKMLTGLKDKVLGAAKGLFGGSSGGGGAGVQRWSSVVLQALRLVGQPPTLLPVVLRRMNQESGGNQYAINKWDINAKRGDPSRGLMQTIGSTFNAYAGKLRGRGIYDPLANVYASMRYALATYGSLSSAYNRAGGYASGGRPRAGELAWVGERGPELVRFGGGDTQVYDHRTSLGMASDLGILRGFAKGTSKTKARAAAKAAARARAKARSEVPGDLGGFTRSLTGSASDISSAANALVKDLRAAGGAGKFLAGQTGKVSAKLQALAKQRDSVDSRLEAAKTAAADQKKTAADFFGLGSQTSATSIGELLTGLKGKQGEAATFQGQIARLSKRGLNQDLIRQLVEQGPGGSLIGMVSGASKSQLDQLNTLAKSGAKLSTSYGNTMADAMFDSGKQAGMGFLSGLKAQEKELQKAMDRLGGQLVSAIKKRLKIKSPSRVTAAIGAQTAQGVVVGLDSTASTVAAAAARVADAAVPAPTPAAVGATVSGSTASGLAAGTRLRLVVGGREFDAYLEEVADGRVAAGFTRARRQLESRK